jgi:hypothetical protein
LPGTPAISAKKVPTPRARLAAHKSPPRRPPRAANALSSTTPAARAPRLAISGTRMVSQ